MGYYSNGANYWYIPPACKEYTFTNNLGYDESVSYYDCNGVVQILLVYDATTSSAVCIDAIINLNGLTDNYNGAGACPTSTTGIFQDQAVCPTTSTTSTTSTSTSTSTTSTSTTSTSTSTSTTSTSTSTSTTTEPPTTTTSTSTSTTAAPTSTSTTSTTTIPLPPGETSTTTTSTTEPPTTTTTSTSTTTTTTTAAPQCTYDGLTIVCDTNTTTTTTQPPTTTTSTSTSTSTSTTTFGTTAAPTVDIYINTVSSLDTPITGMTIDGVAVTWSGAGPDFILSAGDNGQFTSTKIGTYDVVISYGTHTSGQRIIFTDSNSVVTCQTLNGSSGTFTITGATITAATTISVYSEDGICA
jgi:hypothetical protein